MNKGSELQHVRPPFEGTDVIARKFSSFPLQTLRKIRYWNDNEFFYLTIKISSERERKNKKRPPPHLSHLPIE